MIGVKVSSTINSLTVYNKISTKQSHARFDDLGEPHPLNDFCFCSVGYGKENLEGKPL